MLKANVHPDGGIPAPPGAVLYKGKNQSIPAHLVRRRHRRRSCNGGRCCITSLCSTALVLVMLIGIAVLVFWLFVRPKSPHYSVGNVRITGLEPSKLSSSTSNGTLNTNTTFAIEARNPNTRIGFYYDEINVQIDILGVQVGNGNLPPFYQGHKNSTFLSDTLKSGPLSVVEVTQAGILSGSQTHKVSLNFKVNVKARVKLGSWKSPKFKINAHCTTVVNPSDSTRIGTPGQDCSYKGQFWIF